MQQQKQSSEDAWAQGQTPQRIQKECEEWLLLPSGAQQGVSQHLPNLKREVSPTKFPGDPQWSL